MSICLIFPALEWQMLHFTKKIINIPWASKLKFLEYLFGKLPYTLLPGELNDKANLCIKFSSSFSNQIGVLHSTLSFKIELSRCSWVISGSWPNGAEGVDSPLPNLNKFSLPKTENMPF